MKTCKTCKKPKGPAHFGKVSSSPTGKSNECLKCNAARTALRRIKKNATGQPQ